MTMQPFDCTECGLRVEPGYPDPCWGDLPGVDFACCGHGGEHPLGARCYIRFSNGTTVYFSGHVWSVTPRCETVENGTRCVRGLAHVEP